MANLRFLFVCMLVFVHGVCSFTSPLTNTAIRVQANKLVVPQLSPRTSTTQLSFAVAPEVWTSLLPPLLGYYKQEYGVSYGYGFATALSALSIMRRFPNSILPLHAMALVFYGLRLNVFLGARVLLSSRIQEIQTGIEERAVAKGNRWKTRTPFLLSCGFLYYGLMAPLLFTSKLTASMLPSWGKQLLQTLVGIEWFGFGLAAFGDFTKTYVKKVKKDENRLVTGGIFSILRHPNYTGEIIGWTANALCGLVAASLLLKESSITVPLMANLVTMTLGWVGILFVLLRASCNLEAKQKKEHGSDPNYDKWISSTWSGWQLPAKAEEVMEPHIEVVDVIEEYGSGI
jgi:steroid 5-alpha reductase family enzyme